MRARTRQALLACAAIWLLAPAPAAASEIEGACAWPVRDNADLVNVAFPDESAHYWGSLASGIPETGVVVRGRYPRARYFSLNTYNMTLGAFDVLTDRDIVPAAGVNRFRRPHRGSGRWKVRILPGDPPAKRPANTMYTGSTRGVPNPGAIVLYRVYVPDDPRDPEGGAGLPTATLTVGGRETVRFAGCSITSELPGTPLNGMIRDLSFPDGVALPSRAAKDPPQWHKFFGFAGVIANFTGVAALEPLLAPLLPPGAFLNNLDNHYMTAAISRQYGELVVLRAKMPTFPDTRGGEPAWRRSQLRYWSICQNHAATQRYVACKADDQSVLGPRRRATFVISDPDDRPANARRKDGVNWLPWGGIYPDGQIIYRQMLAAPRFKRALAPVEPGEALGPALGPYLPRIAHCTQERFERAGARGCLRG